MSDLPPELTVEADGPVRGVVTNRPAEAVTMRSEEHRQRLEALRSRGR